MNSEEMEGIFNKLNGVIDKDKISPDMVNNLLSMLESRSNTETPSDTASFGTNIDMETMLKMKSMIELMNQKKEDPRSNLLLSLKPYLKESRKEKLDQYVQLMNMSKFMNFFPFMGGGNKKDG